MVEKTFDVRIYDVVNSLPRDLAYHFFYRHMAVLSRTESIHVPAKLWLIYRLDDFLQSQLDDFIFVCCDSKWTHVSISFRYVDTQGGGWLIRFVLQTFHQVSYVLFQVLTVFLFRHSINTNCFPAVQFLMALGQQFFTQQMIKTCILWSGFM